MLYSGKAFLLFLVFVFSSLAISAQSVKTNKTSADNQQTSTQSEKRLPTQKEKALSILYKQIDIAKGFEDTPLKFKAYLLLADALWDFDRAQAIKLFEEAFKVVHTAKGLGVVITKWQSETLLAISRKDSVLAKKLLEIYKKDSDEAIAKARKRDNDRDDPFEAQIQTSLYFQLAIGILASNPQQALEYGKLAFAQRASGYKENETLPRLLFELKKKDRRLAQELFHYSLKVDTGNPISRLERISMLAFYVFPDFGDSRVRAILGIQNFTETKQEPDLEAINRYLEFVCQALRPDANQDAATNQPNDMNAAEEYMFIGQLLPYFEKYMPDKVELIKNHLALTLNKMSPKQREMFSNAPTNRPDSDIPKEFEKPFKEMMNEWQKEGALWEAYRKGNYEDALAIAEKLIIGDRKTEMITAIRLQLSLTAFAKGDIEGAVRHAEALEDLDKQTSLFIAMAEKSMAKKDPQRATEFLDKATQLINKYDNRATQARALLALSSVLVKFDKPQGFATANNAVTLLNQAEIASSWEDGYVPDSVSTSPDRRRTISGIASLDLGISFTLLARSDWERALSLAQTIGKKEASLFAQIAVCQIVLGNGKNSALKSKGKTPPATEASPGNKPSGNEKNR